MLPLFYRMSRGYHHYYATFRSVDQIWIWRWMGLRVLLFRYVLYILSCFALFSMIFAKTKFLDLRNRENIEKKIWGYMWYLEKPLNRLKLWKYREIKYIFIYFFHQSRTLILTKYDSRIPICCFGEVLFCSIFTELANERSIIGGGVWCRIP